MKSGLSLITILLLTVFTLTAQTPRQYTTDVGRFTELRIKNSIPVDYVESEDSAGIVTFAANDTVSQAIVFENKNGKLTISLEPRTFGRKNFIPRVTVRSRALHTAANEGDSLVRILGLKTMDKFHAKLTGNGTLSVQNIDANEVKAAITFGAGRLNITGKCDKAILDNTGQGIVQAGGLKSRVAVCYIMGTGNIDCNVSEDLSIKGMGSGTVLYSGTPKEVRNRGIGIKTENCANCE